MKRRLLILITCILIIVSANAGVIEWLMDILDTHMHTNKCLRYIQGEWWCVFQNKKL